MSAFFPVVVVVVVDLDKFNKSASTWGSSNKSESIEVLNKLQVFGGNETKGLSGRRSLEKLDDLNLNCANLACKRHYFRDKRSIQRGARLVMSRSFVIYNR
jgi:hypothetical protein